MREKGKGLFGEFREFIMRGNVVDMAVGVIIATAFGNITNSLVGDLLMPFIGWLIGDIDLTQLNIVLVEEVKAGEEIITPGVVLGIGTFITVIIDFILIALIVFLILKTINKASAKMEAKKKEEEAAAAEADPAPTTEQLLTEILDELKKK
jgi:large conductance mechanosensitive channel protein